MHLKGTDKHIRYNHSLEGYLAVKREHIVGTGKAMDESEQHAERKQPGTKRYMVGFHSRKAKPAITERKSAVAWSPATTACKKTQGHLLG